ncbi:Rgp1-domain-containing protein [Lipomyces oligophaga]|uniref:Rgp1-domain-containing protein n=1 Tax=Lipomyces oligophaga TaxID=45792 RepID=UPI0034CF1DC7
MLASSSGHSPLRVDVTFSDPVYFAGEDLLCRITFRNVSPVADSMTLALSRTASSSRLRRTSSYTSVDSQHSIPPRSPSLALTHPFSPQSSNNPSTATVPTTPISVSNPAFPTSPSIPSQASPSILRPRNSLRVPKSRTVGETLMMGYAQISGQFTLDESLVETSVFNEAKSQGIVGGKMGGGVVGLGHTKQDQGLFGLGFGFTSGITSGLQSLINGAEVSSIAEMKSMASSNIISILSTPQSLLFVDLRLNPGESKSYTYRFTLPTTLPPSYRGKALKIAYNLTIGTQRGGKGLQQPKITKFPFRVFQHIDAGGNQPIHSLSSPIIILRDQSITVPIDDAAALAAPLPSVTSSRQVAAEKHETLEDFMAYVDTLLAVKESRSVASRIIRPLSPSSPPEFASNAHSSRSSCRESVDFAIQRNSISVDGLALNNIFEITRNKQKIASLTLSKPAYKLGETIIMVLDFAGAPLPCYHICASLETTETIDQQLALRSAQFVERSTRKVYVQSAFTTISCRQATFSFSIPATATPQFDTNYISSRWSIRLEFVTIPHVMSSRPSISQTPSSSSDVGNAPLQSLESVLAKRLSVSRMPSHHVAPPALSTQQSPESVRREIPISSRSSTEDEPTSPMSPEPAKPFGDNFMNGDAHQGRTSKQAVVHRARSSSLPSSSLPSSPGSATPTAIPTVAGVASSGTMSRPLSGNMSQSVPLSSMLLSQALRTLNKPEILQLTHRDDRSIIYVAVETLASEKFECRIPIKVFPTNQDIAAMSFQLQPSGGYTI